MRLYTISTPKAFRVSQQQGRLAGSGKHAFRPAYHWMAGQMAARIGPPTGRSRYPVWGWVEKPDLRESGHLPAGDKGYRLTVEIPEERMLLSDFDMWHFVLNGDYLPVSEADEVRFEASQRKLGGRARRAEIEASWPRIFELDGERDRDWWGESPRLQATFWHVERSEVLVAPPFTAR